MTYKVLKGSYERLGVWQEEKTVCFALDVRENVSLSLLLYKKGGELEAEIPFPEEKIMGNVYAMKIEGLKTDTHEYNYRLNGEVIQDPYATKIVGKGGFGEPAANASGHDIRCGFYREKFDWGDDKAPRIPYEDAVMYSLHVRGFTKQKNSKVRNKGTFKGVTEKIEYLKELGVNQVKLMPIYEFDEVVPLREGMSMNYMQNFADTQRMNFWGYGSAYYFAPKASYAAGNDAVTEFKNLVKDFHKEGMEVLMEVCFTDEVSPRMATQCLLWWVNEYHVNGFRLICNDRLANIIAQDPLLAGTKLLGIYFPPEEIYPRNYRPAYRNLAECNDGFKVDIRRLLKSDEDQLKNFTYRLKRNPQHSGVINYIANHDGFTLMDLVSYDEKHNEENGEQNRDGCEYNYSWNCGVEGKTKRKKIVELRARQIKNAFAMVLLSAGTPMIQAGDEFGNSQNGNNNPYCHDSEVSWVDWRAAKTNEQITQFVRDLIAFRKEHKIIHMPEELRLMDTMSCGYPDMSYHGDRAWYGAFEHTNRQIGVMYCGMYAKQEEFIYAAYNLHWTEHEFALPNMPENFKWHIAVDTAKGVYAKGSEPIVEGEKTITVPARTIMILVGRK